MNVEHFTGVGIAADHDRYLPPSGTGDECSAICPGPIPFECTRDPKHEDDHAAHSSREGRRQFARWPRKAS